MNADLLLKADSLFDEEKFNEAIIFYERLDRNNYQCPKFYYNYAYSLKKEKYHSEVSWIGYKAIQIILEKEDQTECLELFVKCHILIGESYVQMCKKSLDTKYIVGKKDNVIKQKLKAIAGEVKLQIIFDIVEEYSRIITEKKYQALKIQTYVESEIQYFPSEKDSLKKMRGLVAIRDDELRHEIEDFLKKNPWAYNYSRYDCFQNLDM
eukprot:403358400